MIRNFKPLGRAGVKRLQSVKSLRQDFPYFSVFYTKDTPLRVAVVVSKKVAPKAIDRNTIRRRIKEAFSRAFSGVRIESFLLIRAKAAARGASFELLERAALEAVKVIERHQ